jgi:hypothetical protein
MIARWAKTLGLELEEYQRGLMSYISPLFEENAMVAANVPVPRNSWRRGDLVILECVGPCRAKRPQIVLNHDWEERSFEDVRIRVRRSADEAEWGDPSLNRLTKLDVFPTVSRRDRRRDLVDVWTSGNRVFGCKAPAILLQILGAISADKAAIANVARYIGRDLIDIEKRQVRQAERELRRIIQAEAAELCAWRKRHVGMDVVTS